MHRWILTVILCAVICNLHAGGFFLDVEGGVAFPGYNDVQVPNDDTGSRFSLSDVLDVQSRFIYRIRFGMTSGRNTFYLFAAPLSLKGSGTLSRDIDFAGTTFSQGQEVDGTYRFDSYRLTWRYLLVDKANITLWGGLTAKIRDAEIRLESGGTSAYTDNTGFVPLLSFDLRWRPFISRLTVIMEGDALVGPQGRAEDVFLGLSYPAGDRIDLRTGYRIIEGGADVESVYNFTLINFAVAGVTVRI